MSLLPVYKARAESSSECTCIVHYTFNVLHKTRRAKYAGGTPSAPVVRTLYVPSGLAMHVCAEKIAENFKRFSRGLQFVYTAMCSWNINVVNHLLAFQLPPY